MKLSMFSLFFLALGAFLFSGCNPPATEKGTAKQSGTQSKKDDHADDHDHDGDEHGHDEHDHPVHGPNHGDLFEIDGIGFGELCYSKDNNLITLVMLNDDHQTPHPIQADSIDVVYSGGKEPETYKLAAVEKSAEGKAHKFALDSQEFATSVFLGCEVKAKDGEKELTFKMEKMDRHNH